MPKVCQPREGHEKSSANIIAYPHKQSTEEIEARKVGKGLSVKYDRLNTHGISAPFSNPTRITVMEEREQKKKEFMEI